MEQYLANQEISGGSLLVRKNGEVVYQNKWGFADLSTQKPIEYDSIYRMMSMTKCVTAIGILKLVEQGSINLDDPLSRFIPALQNMPVSCDSRYRFTEGMKMKDLLLKLVFFKMSKVRTEPSKRDITIRDMLSHSSGLEQGIVGLLAMTKDKHIRESLAKQAAHYAGYVLDFQPGTSTGYSPIAGFDMLARVIEIVSGLDIASYFQQEIFIPLEMLDTTFCPDDEQQNRLVSLYKRERGRLINVTGSKDDTDSVLRRGAGYFSGAGGLYSTLNDYENLANMLCNRGAFKGEQFLSPETVELMHAEAPTQHLEPEPGFVWGLGVKIRQDPNKGNSFATEGAYGWSGAFGTHFFISPKDNLDCVWLVNRSDLNGAGSYISNKVEELVFGLFT